MQRNEDMNTNDLLYNYLHCTVVLFTIYNTNHNYRHPDTEKCVIHFKNTPVCSDYKRTKTKVTTIYILKILGIIPTRMFFLKFQVFSVNHRFYSTNTFKIKREN